MNYFRKNLLVILGSITVLLSSATSVFAWEPSGKVEIVVPSGPGGALDQVARNLQRIMTEKRLVNVPITVVNKPGASMGVGMAYLRSNPGNGHRIAVFATSQLSGQITGQNPVDYRKLKPISVLFSEYMTTVVNAKSAITDPKGLVNAVVSSSKAFTFGVSPALGTPNHLALATVMTSAGLKVQNLKFVVFKSTPESMAALLGGHTKISSSPPSVILKFLDKDKLRPIAICAPKRLSGRLSSIPTWSEMGHACDIANFRGIGGPGNMTAGQIAYWEDILAKATQAKRWMAYLKKRAAANDFQKSADSKKFMDAQFKGLKTILESVGLAKKK